MPAVAALAVAGGIAVGGCGGSSGSDSSTTVQSQNAAAQNKSDEAMKHEEA